METVVLSFEGLPLFLAYLGTAVVLTLVYIVVYMWVTPHAEITLIRENNLAAALAFAGSLIGFCLPLANTIAGSVSLVDCAIWGLIALVVQILIYYAARVPMPKMSERIENGEMASGVWLGSASLAGGLLNAACMTY
jgi:putative membrane protein